MTSDPEPKRRGRPPSGGREAILDAALALVREEGIARLTSREVATRAGVSDASIYYHFRDREGLLLAVFAHGMKPLEFLSEIDPDRDISAVLSAALAALEQFYDDVLPVFTAAQADAELARTLAAYRAENDLGPHRGVASLSEYMRHQQSRGRVNREIDTEAVALLVMDVAYARVSRRLMHSPDDADARIPAAERMLATIAQLLEPPDPAARTRRRRS